MWSSGAIHVIRAYFKESLQLQRMDKISDLQKFPVQKISHFLKISDDFFYSHLPKNETFSHFIHQKF